MKNLLRSFLMVIVFISSTLSAQQNWQKIVTVDDVCVAFPEQIKSIFQNLNLEQAGLEAVKLAYESNNIPLAAKKLLDYYHNPGRTKYFSKEIPPVSKKINTEADSILQDILRFQQIAGKVPHLADGHLNWFCTGPENDIEWAWALNRHYPVGSLLEAYYENGNKKYISYIDNFIKDWIISSWPYPGVKSNTAMWRGLEVSFRAKVWAQVFFELMDTKLISPATQLLILSSLPQHAHYARNFHAQGNWLTMEISGLATVSAAWPEFKESSSWMSYAVETMGASIKEQIYPDGVQTELTSSYHQVALDNFNRLLEICRKSKIPLPEYYTKTLEDMWNYQAYSMQPNGYGILNNDADKMYNRERILKEATNYHRDDWKYIATNGKSGIRPANEPSFLFPWAGQLISRSDYNADAQWSFFDIGPWGSGHQHNDKLNLTVSAFGRELLVDGGRFAYRGEVADKFRSYAVGSQSHNVILVDGKGQGSGPALAKMPLNQNCYKITKDFDYASGTFDKYNNLEGEFSHTRALFYVRGKFWVEADQIKTDRPRQIETLWHWHPDCQVLEKNGTVSSSNKRGNLTIIPLRPTDWKVSLVKGQEKRSIQGWYSKEYNTYEANTTTVYSASINTGSTFVWVLWPSEGAAANIHTEILSQDSNSVKVRVSETQKRYWDITIPFADSAEAGMKFVSKPDK